MRNLFNYYDAVTEVLSLRPFGLFTDVDGTISEIAPSPGQARVSPICRENLAVLAKQLDVVVAVSGRTAIETREMVGVDDIIYIGNHGYEHWERIGDEVRRFDVIGVADGGSGSGSRGR